MSFFCCFEKNKQTDRTNAKRLGLNVLTNENSNFSSRSFDSHVRQNPANTLLCFSKHKSTESNSYLIDTIASVNRHRHFHFVRLKQSNVTNRINAQEFEQKSVSNRIDDWEEQRNSLQRNIFYTIRFLLNTLPFQNDYSLIPIEFPIACRHTENENENFSNWTKRKITLTNLKL